jgi:hypothetical protein
MIDRNGRNHWRDVLSRVGACAQFGSAALPLGPYTPKPFAPDAGIKSEGWPRPFKLALVQNGVHTGAGGDNGVAKI